MFDQFSAECVKLLFVLTSWLATIQKQCCYLRERSDGVRISFSPDAKYKLSSRYCNKPPYPAEKLQQNFMAFGFSEMHSFLKSLQAFEYFRLTSYLYHYTSDFQCGMGMGYVPRIEFVPLVLYNSDQRHHICICSYMMWPS